MMEKINDADINRVVTFLKIEKRRRGYFIILALVIFISLGLWSWIKYFSPLARENRALQESYRNYSNWENDYKSAMTADTYGGKTPQETLDLFVAALKKGDLELASKYFSLGSDGKTRKEVTDGLMASKTAGKFGDLTKVIEGMEYEPADSDDHVAFFRSKSSGGQDYEIELGLNIYSKTWKIESM